MANSPGIIHRLLTGFWTLIDQGRRFIVNIVFLLILVALVKVLLFSEVATVPSGAALVLKPAGFIVDELDYVDPVDKMFNQLNENSNTPQQTLLRDLISAINQARQDSQISALVLDLGSLYGAAPSKLQDLAQAITEFKSSGKPTYAYSAFYNQAQYYLAAQADEVIMDPLGGVFIEGYGRYNTYFKGALEKLGVKLHIFKVGTYKSAVEPFTRNDMSDEAKTANLDYLGDLWQNYASAVAQARELTADDINRYSNDYLTNLSQSSTFVSKIATDASLVDKLMDGNEFTNYLIEKVGGNQEQDDFLQLNHNEYLKIIRGPFPSVKSATDKVAVVVAKGVIYNGNKKAGSIGGNSTAKLIRRARLDDSVKALVLRVDSPGGSAYASEIIRREVIRTREAGKPVVISMGSYAASGGYWISASADEIWASPTTITGSIGIFGMLPTFEQPLNNIGIYRDGVGTTSLSGAFDPAKPLREDVGKAIQSSIENGYKRFLSIVSEGRGMDIDAVDKIAQGRVWSGKKALEIGLVDNLGNIDDAIESAAGLAGMMSFETIYIEQKITDSERFIKSLFNSSIMQSILSVNNTSMTEQRMLSPALVLLQQFQESYKTLTGMNDPQNLYAHCLCIVE